MIRATAILFAAFILDLLLGDPHFRFHPVRLMGFCVSVFEKLLRGVGLSGLVGGAFLAAGVIGFSVAGYWTVRSFLGGLHFWLAAIFDLYLTYSCLALADLLEHARPVAAHLKSKDLTQAQAALQKIVGRDAATLNSVGVARGTVESVAENFVDGVLSPLFWYTAGALLCQILQSPTPTAAAVSAILGFKAISTLDSMVGYRDEHYLLFGRPAARLDDIVNFIPARLSMVILYVGALISGEKAGTGWKVARRDRLKHVSPNAGHSESFVAGALGIRLGGPSVYKDATVEKPWLGNGSEQVGPEHILRCCRLIYRSSWATILLCVTVLLVLSALGE